MPSILYTVKEGDTLWKIAQAFGTTVNDIARYNGIIDTDVLYPGQQLRVFVPEGETGPDNTAKWYTVRPGDSLTEIAQQFDTTAPLLMWLNDIAVADLIYPGQRLRVRP